MDKEESWWESILGDVLDRDGSVDPLESPLETLEWLDDISNVLMEDSVKDTEETRVDSTEKEGKTTVSEKSLKNVSQTMTGEHEPREKGKNKPVKETQRVTENEKPTEKNMGWEYQCMEDAISRVKQMFKRVDGKSKESESTNESVKEEQIEDQKNLDTAGEVTREPWGNNHLGIYGLLSGDIRVMYKCLNGVVETFDLKSKVWNMKVRVILKMGQEGLFKVTGQGVTKPDFVVPLSEVGTLCGFKVGVMQVDPKPPRRKRRMRFDGREIFGV